MRRLRVQASEGGSFGAWHGRPTLRRSSAYSVALTVVRMAVSVAAIPVLTRTLGLAGYGVWAIMASLLGFSSIFQFGLAPAVSYYTAQAREDEETTLAVLRTSFVMFLVLGTVIAGLLAASASAASRLLFGRGAAGAEVSPALAIVGLAVLLQFIRNWLIAVESGRQRYDIQAWAEGVGNILLYSGLIVVTLLGHGLVAMAVWLVGSSALTIGLHWRLLCASSGSSMSLRFGWSRPHARSLVRYGSAQWLSLLSSSAFGQVDRVVVGVVLGPAPAGLYAAATAVASRITELSVAPLQVIAPALAESSGERDWVRVGNVYDRAMRLNVLLCFGLAVAVMLFASPIADILTPSGSGTASRVLQIAALAYGSYSLAGVGYFAAQGLGMPSINARWGVLSAVLFLGSLLVSVRTFGLLGAAWSNLAYVACLGINFEVAHRLGARWVDSVRWNGRFLLGVFGVYLLVTGVLTPSDVRTWLPVAVASGVIAVWVLPSGSSLGRQSKGDTGLQQETP